MSCRSELKFGMGIILIFLESFLVAELVPDTLELLNLVFFGLHNQIRSLVELPILYTGQRYSMMAPTSKLMRLVKFET